MLKKLLTITLISTTLISANAAMAKDHGRHDRWENAEYDRGRDGRDRDRHNHNRGNRVVINKYYNDYRYVPSYRTYYNTKRVPSIHYRRFIRGEFIPNYVKWSYLPDDYYPDYYLPPRARYVAVDRDVYMVDRVTMEILDVIAVLSNIR